MIVRNQGTNTGYVNLDLGSSLNFVSPLILRCTNIKAKKWTEHSATLVSETVQPCKAAEYGVGAEADFIRTHEMLRIIT